MGNDETPKFMSTALLSNNYTTADWSYRPEEHDIGQYRVHDACQGAAALRPTIGSTLVGRPAAYLDYGVAGAALHNIAANWDKNKEIKVMATPSARLVRVLVVDTDKRLPLEDRILFKGCEQLTDLTDQELFYEIDISGLLKTHNNKRSQVPIKKCAKEEDKVYLDPVRIKDLSMVVTVIASF